MYPRTYDKRNCKATAYIWLLFVAGDRYGIRIKVTISYHVDNTFTIYNGLSIVIRRFFTSHYIATTHD